VKVVVVGGGLAGLAAALDLVDEGHEVTLLEARPTLGGAVQTLPEREGDPDPPPDNGQHIALGCFEEYLRFLDRIGEAGSYVRRRLALPVVGEDGSVATIRPTLRSLLAYRHLPFRERLRLVRVLQALRRVPNEPPLNVQTFGELLQGLGASQLQIDRFWDVFLRPALNLPTDEAGAVMGLFTVRTALLGPRSAGDLVLPATPLGEMHGGAARAALETAGATVRTGMRVESLDDLNADAVVLAVPPAEAARLLDVPDPGLEYSPIVSVHMLFDRQILRHPLAALLGSPAHWVFDRGRVTGQEPEGTRQYLSVVSSGAPELLEVRGRELVELMAAEVTGRLGEAELLWSRVSREPQATVALRPETEERRPGPGESGRPHVVLAGAWTATGWPATMESAVRSGRNAARSIVSVEAVAA
jgi:squalene-associated FAD-dependent desaturase